MPKFSEETLIGWSKPPSDNEEAKLANAERMIRDALNNSATLSKLNYEIFGQGSYANDTNVRLNSDIDINVRLTSTVRVETPQGKTMQDYGYTPSSYTFEQYRNDVRDALVAYFGQTEVSNSNKCLKIRGNTYRVQADVVPTFRLDEYLADETKRIGSWFVSSDNSIHTNYATQHISNGKTKNANTNKRFKRLCRIVKRVRYRMIDENVAFSGNITSFLIECLLFNVPDDIFNSNYTWTEILRQAIIYLYQKTLDQNNVKDWGEVSECLYLFHAGRKWSVNEVNQFMQVLWNYLQYT